MLILENFMVTGFIKAKFNTTGHWTSSKANYIKFEIYINIMEDVIYEMKKEMLRRKYSYKTIKTYIYCVKGFLVKCQKELNKITKKDIKEFLLKYETGNTINVYLNSIKFLFLSRLLNKFSRKYFFPIYKLLSGILAKTVLFLSRRITSVLSLNPKSIIKLFNHWRSNEV